MEPWLQLYPGMSTDADSVALRRPSIVLQRNSGRTNEAQLWVPCGWLVIFVQALGAVAFQVQNKALTGGHWGPLSEVRKEVKRQ